MIRLSDIKHIYFIGIGGIGMSALARYFHSLGIKVSGYDRSKTVLTTQLENEGISIHYVDDVELADKKADVVVYTPAIPTSHQELDFFKKGNYPVLKRSDVLQIISEHSFNICVAGTHGKTTITTMIAYILRGTGFGCNAFLGGISSNYGTNFWSDKRNLCVIEADEYDRSFHKLTPDIAVISAMDPDHLEIYGTAEEMENAYVEFTARIRKNGKLISRKGLSRERELMGFEKFSYGIQEGSDYHAHNIRVVDGSFVFDIISTASKIKDVVLPMGGRHNVENCTAAIAVALELGIEGSKIKEVLNGFKGVQRRFEFGVRDENFVYIDDYAHHPEELRVLINGVRELYAEKEIVVMFQPHLFTRTKDHVDSFAAVLDEANEIIILPIYPARELPIEGVKSELIRDKMKNSKVSIKNKEEILTWIRQSLSYLRGKVLVSAGAGDIDQLVEPIKKLLVSNGK